MMFDVALFIFFVAMSYRVFRSVRREASIFAEFKQSQSLAILAPLFPLGPVLLLIGSIKFSIPIAYVAAITCYLPCMLIARRQLRVLDVAGTDRVQNAKAALHRAFGTSLVGLIYIAVHFALFIVVT